MRGPDFRGTTLRAGESGAGPNGASSGTPASTLTSGDGGARNRNWDVRTLGFTVDCTRSYRTKGWRAERSMDAGATRYLEDFRVRGEAIAEACTRCGACFRACPM